jgi:hypothetical protein
MIVNVEKIYNLKNDFSGYKITLSDNKEWFVPLDEANTDYQEIQEWAKIEGNNIIDPGA